MIPIEYKKLKLPPFNRKEILRYAGLKTDDGTPMEECICEMQDIEGAVVFTELDIVRLEDSIDFGAFKTSSKDLSKNLGSSEKVLIFAATIGILPDRLIAKYSKLSPTKAMLIQAIATERIEAFCDAFCEERRKYYTDFNLNLKPRFSPGYGDLPLELQKHIISMLDCQKYLGISLTESLLMMPSKSVTAIVGLYCE